MGPNVAAISAGRHRAHRRARAQADIRRAVDVSVHRQRLRDYKLVVRDDSVEVVSPTLRPAQTRAHLGAAITAAWALHERCLDLGRHLTHFYLGEPPPTTSRWVQRAKNSAKRIGQLANWPTATLLRELLNASARGSRLLLTRLPPLQASLLSISCLCSAA